MLSAQPSIQATPRPSELLHIPSHLSFHPYPSPVAPSPPPWKPLTACHPPSYHNSLSRQLAADNSAKISHHEARTSLLGGQPLDRNYLPPNYAYPPYSSPAIDAQPGGYHERQGFPTQLPPPVRRSRRMYIPNTKWTWSYLIAACLQAIIALALEAYVWADTCRSKHHANLP